MQTNPFDAADGEFLALANDEEQFSLWPVFAPIPDGWSVRFGPDSRENCLGYIEVNWADMRPKSLRERSGGQVQRMSDAAHIPKA